MPRTFYTIEDLATFCKQNNFARFSSKEHGNKPLIVQSVETFEVSDNSKDGLMPVSLKSCHIGVNRNQSCISEEVMKADMSSFKGRPILANIIKTDTGEYEFHSHDVTFNEDGEMEYLEHPVGVISQLEEPYLEYDKDEDKTYLHVNGHIFTEYSRAAEILERRRTCKCSVEIAVNEMSWNGEEDYLSIDAFTFMGVTILGYEQDGVTEIQEGMKGSKITIDSFSADNSMLGMNYQEKMIEVLDRLNTTISNFNKNSEKGGEEEMVDVEGIVVEEELNEPEVVVVEEQSEGEEVVVNEEIVSEETSFEDGDEEEVVVVENEEEIEVEVEEAVVEEIEEKFEIKFELSHDDIRTALYNLLDAYSEDGYSYAWILEVYDNKFIYEDWTDEGYKFFRQTYSKDGDNIAFDGERVEVFNEWLSKAEKDALDELKSHYAELKAFKENYDATALKAEKDAVFASAEYDEIRDSDEFKELMSKMDDYSVDELKVQADLLFAASMKKKYNFEAKPAKKGAVSLNFKAEPDKKQEAYAGLFKK